MSKPEMKFKHTYMTKEKMATGGNDVFSTGYKSYIADEESALNEMLGKEFRGVSNSTLNSVLRREAGIGIKPTSICSWATWVLRGISIRYSSIRLPDDRIPYDFENIVDLTVKYV